MRYPRDADAGTLELAEASLQGGEACSAHKPADKTKAIAASIGAAAHASAISITDLISMATNPDYAAACANATLRVATMNPTNELNSLHIVGALEAQASCMPLGAKKLRDY